MNIADSRHFSHLVKDYLTAFETAPIHDFFSLSPFERGEKLRTLAKNVAAISRPRQLLVDTLRNQHQFAGNLTPEVETNLDLLKKPETLAVVTGQQVGILGGPLYTIYKAITAVALAHELDGLLDDHRVVPIFWQETEDHDLEEATHFGIFDKENNYVDIRYEADEETTKRKQVGSLNLNAEYLEAFWERLQANLQQTEFTSPVLKFCKRCYTPARTFGEAQAMFLGELTKKYGLLILNANTRSLKATGAHLFKNEISSAPQLQQIVDSQTVKLQRSYDSQVQPSPVNLFLLKDEKRYKLEKDGGEFRYDETSITLDKLLQTVDSSPELISPNVVMRPLFQDTLLPTIAYVAGPGEIAYYAQLRDAYNWAKIPMPIIVPRFSATIVEDRVAKVLEKAGTTVEEMIERGNTLIDDLTTSEEVSSIERAFDGSTARIDQELENLRPITARADATLDGALTTLKGKLLTSMRDFGAKTVAAERRKSATLKNQLQKALTAIVPDGALQERQLGLVYFVNKYGLNFAEKLLDVIVNTPNTGEHHLLSATKLTKGELPLPESR